MHLLIGSQVSLLIFYQMKTSMIIFFKKNLFTYITSITLTGSPKFTLKHLYCYLLFPKLTTKNLMQVQKKGNTEYS